jgi:hypothetical protein
MCRFYAFMAEPESDRRYILRIDTL